MDKGRQGADTNGGSSTVLKSLHDTPAKMDRVRSSSSSGYTMPANIQVGNTVKSHAGGNEQTSSAAASLDYSTDGSSAFFNNEQGSSNSLIGNTYCKLMPIRRDLLCQKPVAAMIVILSTKAGTQNNSSCQKPVAAMIVILSTEARTQNNSSSNMKNKRCRQ
jgi:hypothetical protein